MIPARMNLNVSEGGEEDEEVMFSKSKKTMRSPTKYKHKEENKLDKMLTLLEKWTSEVQDLKDEQHECAKQFKNWTQKLGN